MPNSKLTNSFKIVKRSKTPGGKKGVRRLPAATGAAPSTSGQKDDHLKILKQFDLDWKYGPCIGIGRLERWERAYKHGFDPPQLVKDTILQHQDDSSYTECLWNDYLAYCPIALSEN